jgi:hypothetical protein
VAFQAHAFHGDMDDRPSEPFVGENDIAPASQDQDAAPAALGVGQRVRQRSHVGHLNK